MINIATLNAQLTRALQTTELPGLEATHRGKVRDSYVVDGKRYLITTDRISAFDRVLCTIPFKGQVLNSVAAFWFSKLRDQVPNHMLGTPDPQVMEVVDCKPLPVEMVIRAYLTGSTSTSIWTHYERGERIFCGNLLPDGMRKHQKLKQPILTPSTKAEQGEHDVSVSPDELIARGTISTKDFERIAEMSFTLFALGQEHCAKQGLILVDTKYEFGKTAAGQIVVIDEVHTPDSSRLWQAGSYQENFATGADPQGLDKEYVRTWLKRECDFSGQGVVPFIPDEIRIEAARRYISACEQVTGEAFSPDTEEPQKRLIRNLGLAR